MKMLKKFAAPLAIAAMTLSFAGAAQAQPMRPGGWSMTPARTAQVRQDIYALDAAIDRAAARRTISRREAVGLHRQSDQIKRTYTQYQRGGLDRQEVRNLQDRVNTVRASLRMERRDWDDRRG